MITYDLATAKILIVLASDRRSQVQELTRDLQRSSYSYYLEVLSNKTTIYDGFKQLIDTNRGRLPIVFVISHKFAGKASQGLLELAGYARRLCSIACIVTDPPVLQCHRQALVALGARLFDDEDRSSIEEIRLH